MSLTLAFLQVIISCPPDYPSIFLAVATPCNAYESIPMTSAMLSTGSGTLGL